MTKGEYTGAEPHDSAVLSGLESYVRAAIWDAPVAVHLWLSVMISMKTILKLSLLTVLLFASDQCLAEMMIEDVSKERAKALGVTFRTNMDGDAGVKVWLEFRTNGKFEKFTRVELRIGEGKNRIMSAPLLASHPSPGSVAVHFSADPAYLATSTLTIVVADVPLGGSGYRFKVKDIIELKKSQ